MDVSRIDPDVLVDVESVDTGELSINIDGEQNVDLCSASVRLHFRVFQVRLPPNPTPGQRF